MKKILLALAGGIILIVGARGIWAYRHMQINEERATNTAVPGVATTATSTAPMPPVDETANWKTYTNEKYGFSFEYPGGWNFSEGTSTQGGKLVFSVDFTSPSLSYQDNFKTNFGVEIISADPKSSDTTGFLKLIGADVRVIKSEKISVSGIVGDYYKDLPGESSYNESVFLHGGKYFGISQFTDNETYRAVLSTFKFANTEGIN